MRRSIGHCKHDPGEPRDSCVSAVEHIVCEAGEVVQIREARRPEPGACMVAVMTISVRSRWIHFSG